MTEKLPTSLKPYRAGLGFAFTNAITWMIVLSSPMVLMAEQLRASAFAVGLAYSAAFLTLPVQIVATAAIPRLGFKRQMILCWTLRAIGSLIALWLAFLAPADPKEWMRWIFIAGIYFFCFFRSFGTAASTPWLFAWVPKRLHGRYFATDQTVSSFCGIMLLLFLTFLFDKLPGWDAFRWAYAISLVGTVLSIFFLSKVPDVPRPNRTSLGHLAKRAGELVSRPSPYRHFLGLVLSWWLVAGCINPFVVYYLKTEAGISSSSIMFYTAFQSGGTILGAITIRTLVDRFGVRPFFVTSLLLHIVVGLYWLLLLTVLPGLIKVVEIQFFLMGLAASNWFAPNLKYLPQLCEEHERPLAVAVNTAATGVAAGLAPVLWGLFIKQSGDTPGVQVDRFTIYFVILIIVQMLLIIPFSRLKETDAERPALITSGIWVFRILSSLINLNPPPDTGKKR